MKPEIFNTEMVRATLDDRKTNMRRVCKVQPRHNDIYADQYNHNPMQYAYWALDNRLHDYLEKTPYKVGDIIYVRETWTYGVITGDWSEISGQNELWIEQTQQEEDTKKILYKADLQSIKDEGVDCSEVFWKPSIHMPKEYSRLFLRVKDVRVERLNEISEEDAIKEGLLRIEEDDGIWYPDYIKWGRLYKYAKSSFQTLWESIYGKDSFDNRYVWVIEFERISKEEAINV